MKIKKYFTTGLSALAFVTFSALGQTIIKTERFDAVDSSIANGWVELGSRANGMDYGYSPGTAYAGGATGNEAGGKVGRNQIRSMYADVFGTFPNLDTPLTATGRLAVAFQNGNAAVVIGHSDSTRIGLNQDSLAAIGIRTVPSARQLEAVVGLTNVVRTLLVVNGTMDVTGVTNYNWRYSWNPSGGTSSTGALTVAVSDNFGGLSSFTNTVTLSISAADRNQNPRFDSFGLTTRALAASAVYAQTYVDDVSYLALPSCVRIAPATVFAVVGQTNKQVTVTIPSAANVSSAVYIKVTSPSPAIAQPLGAVAGSLTLAFPAGSANTQTFYVQGVGAGNVNLTLSNTNGICFADTQVAVTVAPSATTLVKTEVFNTAISARTNGWSELGSRLNGQNFGFSASTNAGGPAGEAGGDFRRDTTRATYADVFAGKLTLNDALHASGTVIMPTTPGTNAGPIIGHSDSAKVGQATEANLIGLEGVNTAAGVPEFRARLVLANGTGYEPAGPLSPAVIATVYYWDYSYDPTGGTDGNGTLTVNISDGISFITNTTVITLTASDRAIGAEFDSFGVTSRSLSTSSAVTTAFIDNVIYTSVVGSPCVRYSGVTAFLNVVGQTNKSVSVSIPAASTTGSDFHVRVSSLNPSVAVPLGSDGGGQLDLTFPAGGDVTKTFFVNAFTAGIASFQLSNTNGVCTDTNLVVVTVPCSSITTAKSELFDSQSSAAAHGWVEFSSRTNGQNFGFSATANAGSAGEAGGNFKRDSIRSSYVDILRGRLTLNDYITASGRISVPGSHSGNLGPNIGHSDSTKTGLNSASVGQAAEANNLSFSIVFGTNLVPELILADGSRHGEVSFFTISTNTVYDWYYVYDPAGGASGNGSLTCAVIAGGVTNIGVYTLTAGDRAIGAQFDSFGLTSRALASSTATGPAFIDNVTYSVPVPLRILGAVALGNGNLRLTIASPSPCGSHLIQERAALTTSNWSTVTNVTFSRAANNQLTAEFAKPSGAARFYRVALP